MLQLPLQLHFIALLLQHLIRDHCIRPSALLRPLLTWCGVPRDASMVFITCLSSMMTIVTTIIMLLWLRLELRMLRLHGVLRLITSVVHLLLSSIGFEPSTATFATKPVRWVLTRCG